MAGGDGFIDISFSVVGAEPVVQRLATWGARIEDMSDAWELVGERVLESFALQFEGEGGEFNSGTWAPLAPATVRDRIRQGYPGEHPILVRTRQLWASVVERGAAGNVFDVRPDGVTLGTADTIAPFHQFGTSRMPARPMVGLSWQMRSEVVRILGDWVREQAAEAFG